MSVCDGKVRGEIQKWAWAGEAIMDSDAQFSLPFQPSGVGPSPNTSQQGAILSAPASFANSRIVSFACARAHLRRAPAWLLFGALRSGFATWPSVSSSPLLKRG